MKRFKQFLKEMPRWMHDSPDDADESKLDHDHAYEVRKSYEDEHLGKQSGHHVHSRGKSMYYATETKDGPMKFRTRGHTTEDGYFKVGSTARHSTGSMGADNFYKGILRHGHHKGIESDEDLSGGDPEDGPKKGGMGIWHRLHHNHPDVEVTRHHDGKQVKMHSGDDWHKNFEHPDSDGHTVFIAKLINKKKE